MGGGNYNHTESNTRRQEQQRSGRDAFEFSRQTQARPAAERGCHPSLNPFGITARECLSSIDHPNATPIVVAMDVTRSRGEDAKIMHTELPQFLSALIRGGYVPDPQILFAAIGDATAGDKAPLQVGQFESDNRMDECLENMFLEEGGGGTGQESYELAAYFFSEKTKLDVVADGRKGYMFIIGDEGYYPKVSKAQVKELIGDDLPEDLDSVTVFQKLQEKFHVMFVYPKKSWQERISDIDEEMKQRLTEAGGRFQNVDIRASLMWNTFDDLDLHVITPSGEEIYYGHPLSRCKGELDVDRNAGGRETRKPVENIRWAKGDAPQGAYKVIVQNFAYHDDYPDGYKDIPYTVEVEVNGEIQTFQGIATPAMGTHERSNFTVHEFKYDPADRPIDEARYRNYDDTLIKDQWLQAIPAENLLIIEDPRAIIPVMTGAIALLEGTGDINGVLVDLNHLGSDRQLADQTHGALDGLASSTALATVASTSLPEVGDAASSGSGTTRL